MISIRKSIVHINTIKFIRESLPVLGDVVTDIFINMCNIVEDDIQNNIKRHHKTEY